MRARRSRAEHRLDSGRRWSALLIIGHLTPAGSGIYRYAEIDIQPPAGYEAPIAVGLYRDPASFHCGEHGKLPSWPMSATKGVCHVPA